MLYICLAALVTVAVVCLWPGRGLRARGALPNDVYVWQRAWTERVEEAITEHGTNFSELVALGAEVSWKKGVPEVVRVPIRPEVLRSTGRRIGLALRVANYTGPFKADDAQGKFLTSLAASLVTEAVTNQLAVAELQMDFDCAESKLDGYAVWVQALKRTVTPVPVTITALPAWLDRRAFKRLIAVADGYVLQVHSLARPKGIATPFHLCEPEAARQAVERAGRLGKPFRVALPTYGYLLAFDTTGRFVGLSAEGAVPNWPEGTQVRQIRAEPEAMSGLVQNWTADRPAGLRGVIWYRLPIAGEQLNWHWPTLAAVMAGKIPQSDVRVETRQPNPGLVEIELINGGTGDYSEVVRVRLCWTNGQMVAADGLQGFELAEAAPAALILQNKHSKVRLGAGDRRTIGWVRFNKKTEVQIELCDESKK